MQNHRESIANTPSRYNLTFQRLPQKNMSKKERPAWSSASYGGPSSGKGTLAKPES